MKVLFVCNGNAARSQEAEALFTDPTKGRHATSGGINVIVGKPLPMYVIQQMSQLGFDMKGHFRKYVTEEMAENADRIISFKPKTELPAYLADSTKIEFWDVPDPQNQSEEFFQQVLEDIKVRVDSLPESIERGGST